MCALGGVVSFICKKKKFKSIKKPEKKIPGFYNFSEKELKISLI